MGIGICDRCIKKYYPKRKNGMSMGWNYHPCAKCGSTGDTRGYFGIELDEWEQSYRTFVGWLPKHRRSMGKRKGFKKIKL